MTTEPEPRLRALADFAWVELAPADDTFIPGGVIVAPQSAADRDTYRKATVRSIGPGRYHEGHYYPCGAEVGDNTITRFFILHIGLLPTVTFMLVGLHIMLIRMHGVTELQFENCAVWSRLSNKSFSPVL